MRTPRKKTQKANHTITIRLTGRAARWVRLLQDFGHLDNEGVDRLLIGIADLYTDAHPPDELIDLPVVRRAAAVLLCSDGMPLSPLLEEDWTILFA